MDGIGLLSASNTPARRFESSIANNVRSQKDVQVIMLLEMCHGMIAFGFYAMWLERRNGASWVKSNA
jgi:hypothetical protein